MMRMPLLPARMGKPIPPVAPPVDRQIHRDALHWPAEPLPLSWGCRMWDWISPRQTSRVFPLAAYLFFHACALKINSRDQLAARQREVRLREQQKQELAHKQTILDTTERFVQRARELKLTPADRTFYDVNVQASMGYAAAGEIIHQCEDSAMAYFWPISLEIKALGKEQATAQAKQGGAGKPAELQVTVKGPVRYAEMLVRKKLQESGEFEEPVHILTHWKGRQGKSATEIFFTALPCRLAGYYFDELRQLPDCVLLFPMYAVLWNMLQRMRSKAPVAVILRHHRFADVLVGTSRRVLFASRNVAFDTDQPQVQALWNTIQSDIEAVEQTHRVQVVKILYLNWLEVEELPYKTTPSYQQLVDDLTLEDFGDLVLQVLKVDVGSGHVRLELFGDIQAPFDEAHSGYQRLLQRLKQLGYQIEESRFETRINTSTMVLRLKRPLA